MLVLAKLLSRLSFDLYSISYESIYGMHSWTKNKFALELEGGGEIAYFSQLPSGFSPDVKWRWWFKKWNTLAVENSLILSDCNKQHNHFKRKVKLMKHKVTIFTVIEYCRIFRNDKTVFICIHTVYQKVRIWALFAS